MPEISISEYNEYQSMLVAKKRLEDAEIKYKLIHEVKYKLIDGDGDFRDKTLETLSTTTLQTMLKEWGKRQ